MLQLSRRPYKWIRYATGVVAGVHGHLSTSPNSSNFVDYNAGLPAESSVLYYHTTDDGKRRMCPIDPHVLRTNITSSVATTRRAQFRVDVKERDEGCVVTGYPDTAFDAVHLLAHSKGDSVCSPYIHSDLAQHRNGDSTLQLILSAEVEILLEAIFYTTSMMYGMAFSSKRSLTFHLAKTAPS
jgi:hypothetical protein